MKIIFTNGTELNPIMVTGAPNYFQGVSRDSLTFVFSGDSDMEALDKAFTEAACEHITIVGGDGTEAIHSGYTVRVELVKKQVETQKATFDTEAVFENRVFVTMAQRTYAETQLAAMQAAMNALLTGEEV